MDFNKLVPDFNAVLKTDWTKPQVEKNSIGRTGFIASVLMLVFVFLPWFSIQYEDGSAMRSGITLWYGILGFLVGLVAVASNLYNQKALGFWAAVLAVLFAVIGLIVYPSLTEDGVTLSGEKVKESIEMAKMFEVEIYVSRLGAIFYLLASLASGACSFLGLMKK